MSQEMDDRAWMLHAITEGRLAQGVSYPNPPVGAVLISGNKIISTGYTQKPGFNHAEKMCLDKNIEIPDNAVLYVTLEPCCHHGRTTPCVDLIINKKIRRVVCGIQDPNPKVSGQGLQILQNARVDISVGVQEDIIREDLAEYIWRTKHGMTDGFECNSVSSWDSASETWTTHTNSTSDVYKGIYIPTMLAALGDINDLKILDLGGGEGLLSRVMQSHKAQVTFLDHSPRMKEIAENLDENTNITYLSGDVEEVLPDLGTFDVIITNMLLHDIEPIEKYLILINQALDTGGIFYASILHPCFKSPQHGWMMDENNNRVGYRVDRYGNRGLLMAAVTGKGPGGIPTLNIHRRLSEYLNLLTQCGFVIEQTYEPEFGSETIHDVPFSVQDDYFRRAPVFCWKAVKHRHMDKNT
jgi:pyrimidine deaminase RibD-like protein